MTQKTGAKVRAPMRKDQKRASNDTTRDKILDAAEMLFGERTFDTVSLRDITQQADVTLALASYHFGAKEKLFAEIVRRRADFLNQARRARLAALEASGMVSTESIIDAFMQPLFERMIQGERGWESYLLILAQLGRSNRWLHLVDENFNETAELFLSKLRGTLPNVSNPLLMRGFSMALVAMLHTLSRNRRIDSLSGGTVSADKLDDAYAALLRFVVSGLEGLSETS